MLRKNCNERPVLILKKGQMVLCFIISILSSINCFTFSETILKPVYDRKEYIVQGKDEQLKYPDLRSINSRLHKLNYEKDTASAHLKVDSLIFLINQKTKADSADLAYSCYLVGTYSLNHNNLNHALLYFKKAIEIYEKSGKNLKENYSNSLYNLSNVYNYLGDYSQALDYMIASVENDKRIYGDSSIKLMDGYLALSIISSNTRDYDKAILWINHGLRIAQLHPDTVKCEVMAALYQTKGAAFSFLSNYEQAKSNLEKAETYYDKLKIKDLNYINMLDNLGTTYHFLGSKEKSYEYYEKGMKLINNNFSSTTSGLINNYSIILGNDSLEKKGEALLLNYLKKVRLSPNFEERNYYMILRNYADYLRDYKINEALAKKTYLQCFDYIYNHPWDKDFRDNIILGYSISLFNNGENRNALDSIQTLLFPDKSDERRRRFLINPDSLIPDSRSISILKAKFGVLLSEDQKTNDSLVLEAAAGTAGLIINVLERIRLSIGEEGSRLLLGDKYRDSYLDAISCLNECYRKTNNQIYLEKAFEFSEKSKVASLLASTREMKAMQNNIPYLLANKEKELQSNIGFYSSILNDEESREKPDARKIKLWKDYLLVAKDSRDSLIRIFEKNYPDYYALKYNTKVISLKAIPGLIGRGKNYLSYIVTDSMLYTFVSNARNQKLLAQKIDTSFFRFVRGFRKILTTPDLDEKSADEFKLYQVYGYKLYSYLIEPVKKYLISNELIISPDNILSYLPFEAFPTKDQFRDDLIYKKLPYMMNNFIITYEYSATLFAEYEKAKPALRNDVIVFAPSYTSPVYIDSISNDRQSTGRTLGELPYAQEEAGFVSGITKGTLYSGSSATESIYRQMAGKFDIIHMAMHTYINNQNPIYSKLIFSFIKDSLDNIGLNAFEVYEIPLKAKMVVLSSCNTGAGNLRKGEGVLSLARGFIYSGSKSVVMSLWEVDDKSGTDIVEAFYRNLKNGDSKSKALRKARIKYLKSAGTVRSFPFFWATLVVYGDDSPIYYSIKTEIISAFLLLLVLSGTVYYFRRR